jgi:histidinol-phosphatase (PHP family)
MLADYHVHTPYCGHAKGKIIEYVNAAVSLGLSEIGFADHLGRYYLTGIQRRRYWDWGMEERAVARYVAELLELRELFHDQIRIKIGLEVDYVEGAEDLLEPIVSRYPFDFLLCSVHCIPRFGWKHLSSYSMHHDTSIIYKEYFRVARAALRSGLFNVLAHPDFIWRYVGWPQNEPLMPFQEIADTVRTAGETGRCIEINANGFLWSQANAFESADRDPFEVLIDQCRRSQVSVSIGSDAHEPAMVGKLFTDLTDMLKKKGITSFTCFSEGKPRKEVLG